MKRTFKEAVEHRRTIYGLSGRSPISDNEIKEIIKFAILHVPSAFNSQTARLVLLLNEEHKKFWSIVKETLRKMVSPEDFPKTEQKINKSFASGYGTILFFEDQEVIEHLQSEFLTYAAKFAEWSEHTSAMHQFTLWTMLEDAGFGCNLQHYNPIIDDEVAKTWNLPETWRLIAQMPFGLPIEGPGEKDYEPVEKRFFVFE